jgi:hypothetical protein
LRENSSPPADSGFCDGQSAANLQKLFETVALAPLRGASMSVFQRSFFETKHVGHPIDPAIRANIWADRFRAIITNMDSTSSQAM